MGEPPVFDENWVKAAQYTETDRRPRPVGPQPWRNWTPPPPPRPRRMPAALAILGVLALLVLVSFELRNSRSTPEAAPPSASASGPVASDSGPVVAEPAQAASNPTPVEAPTAAGQTLSWKPATEMPDGPDPNDPKVFASLKVGTCIAQAANLRTAAVVPCSGPHTDEVDLVRDLTAEFPTTPDYRQIDRLNTALCPGAVRDWTGGRDGRYTSGYLWQFQNGVPGQAVRGFVCTAQLSGHGPFTGTLHHAAA
ncbi:septum formation family protein [Dactylosporangium sp. CS-033363]|uniref:septum formation family protein n=1 Tax=Dactylosporangium sp. CS-033363 TaxID=3239935 RepID=UPI003D8D4639